MKRWICLGFLLLALTGNARAAELVQGAGFSVLREADIEG